MLADRKLAPSTTLALAVLAFIAVLMPTRLMAQPMPAPVSIHWSTAELHQIERDVDGDLISLRTTGDDPFVIFELPAVPKSGDRHWMLAMDVICPSGVRDMELYHGHPFTSNRRVDLPTIDPSEGWTTYAADVSLLLNVLRDDKSRKVRVDFGMQANRRLQVRNVQLRLETDREVENRSRANERRERLIALDQRVARYHQTQWPVRIETIAHQSDSILVRGKLNGESVSANLSLISRPLSDVSAENARVDSSTLVKPVRVDVDGRFNIRVPAAIDSPWRATGMRWQIVSINSRVDADGKRETTPRSAVHHVDVYDPVEAKSLSPTPRLRAAKGMTCLSELSLDMVRDLGLQHGSVNIVLSNLVSLESKPNHMPIQIRGRTIHVNESAARSLDARVREGRQAGLVMAGILLIPNRKTDGVSLQHPGADPAGTYSMPNLTDESAAELYAATLDFLASRYSDDERRIDHWIVHNEIDAGWQWTNMGETPMHVYLDHYFRSLRMVDAAMRRVNPHAIAFISLTHHWDDGERFPWRWYPSRWIMEHLVTHGNVEGEFPWGLAHHPYPESLWESDTWNDNVTDSIDTKKVTIKNWSVLDGYLHTPELRAPNGDVRAVLLSEQGFHAKEGDAEALRRQSAALLYTFEKMRQCESILAYDYHRPVDSRGEGGLRLGLRGLSTKEHPRGPAKPAWGTYRVINTPAESILRKEFEEDWSR